MQGKVESTSSIWSCCCAAGVPCALIRYALNRAFSLLIKSASVRAYSVGKCLILFWLPPRDSNPDMLIQSQLSCR